VRRHDGRIVERVRLPLDLVDAVGCEADLRGVDFDTCAGDLVAEALPDALREAAEALLTEGRASLKHETPDIADRGVADELVSAPYVELDDTARCLTQGSPGDAGAS
jgi:hypothetical protein